MASMRRALEDSRCELSIETVWRMFLGHDHDGAVCQQTDTRLPGIYPITLMMRVMTPALGKYWQLCAVQELLNQARWTLKPTGYEPIGQP